FGVEEVTIKDLEVLENSSSTVRIKGKASFLSVKEPMPIETVVEGATGTPKFRLTADLPRAWKFSESFPDLAPYYNHNYDSLDYGYSPSYLNELAFSKPVLILTTHPYAFDDSIQFKKGLNFVAHIAPFAPAKDLEPIFGTLPPLRVAGLVIGDSPK